MDRISELPDSLVTQVLSHLPTKVSVKTSILSKRWESVWRRVPGLDFRFFYFRKEEALESFVNKFLEFNKESQMQTFKFQNEKCNDDRLEEWIETAVARGVQHLSVQIEEIEDIEEVDPPYVTQEIYRRNTLVSLYLIGVGIETPDCAVSLPRLKVMHIEDVQHDDDLLIVENIISGCPVLEVLAIIRTTESESLSAVKSLRVRSQTLRSFKILFENWFGGMHYAVEIDAPSLEYMSFREDNSGVIVVKNLTSLYAIHIDTEFNLGFANYDGNPLGPKDSSKIKTIHDFLEGISGVRHVHLSVYY
ncbi:unnamed protein product [Microthlaspi erraticum]|uniref:F-box domain-containing protein n=1 Tax=Microthlaspi erraticum TaxID=1685480 RepID=A0A6D2HJ63_9BRAS|nr:unnamed protein product [Microthlaspi erraticum]